MKLKVVILAGGIGSRISEESHLKPKPMVDIGGKPILWHIMKIYSSFGLNDFIICGGYKINVIKEYFSNFFLNNNDISFNLENGNFKVLKKGIDNWQVSVIDTGQNTLTGGRLAKIKPYLKNEECFFMTYGDGLANINIKKLYNFHKIQKTKATVTIVRPPGRFGVIKISGKKVQNFTEKPKGDGNWINGGFFVLDHSILNLVSKDDDIWEKKPLETLAKSNQLSAYQHSGFWKCMDTLRDKVQLDEMWTSNKAPWKIWKK